MSLNIEVLPRIPARVLGKDGVTVAKSGGTVTIGYDYTASGLGSSLQQALDVAASSATAAADAQAAAEVAQAAAEDAAGSLAFGTDQQAEEGSSSTNSISISQVKLSMLGVQTAASLSVAEAVNLAASPSVIMVQGNSVAGDGPPAPYVSRLSEPSHSGKTFINGSWYELERHDGVYLEDFGGINANLGNGAIDNTVDNTDAFADAIDYCVKKKRSVIRFNSGDWPCKQGGFEMPVGINLRGHGFSSSISDGGSTLQANYNEGSASNAFSEWTGSGQEFNTTGGGIQNLTVVKGAGKTGGILVRLTGISNSHRPGYMTFQNVKLSGTNSSANCDYCFVLDGSNLTTSGANGIRDVVLMNVWIDGWAVTGAHLVNATHCKILGLAASPTSGALDCIRITGADSGATSKTNSLMAVGLECFGNVILDNIDRCHIECRATDLVISGNVTHSVIIPTVQNDITFSGTIGANPTTRENLRTDNRTIIYDGKDDYLYTSGGAVRVVGPRATGWAAMTGTATRSAVATSTATTQQVAERLKALTDDLIAHGLIGS